MTYAWEKLLKDRGYTILDTLGEGAYSKVKAAYSSELGKEVAIKCISLEGAPKDFIEKFLPRELKILPLLCHKHIVQVHEVLEHYDVSKKNSYVCIVMESARHGDLLQYIQKKGACSEPEIRKFFWQLCQAISYCHSRNICHRDLKCENLLLNKHDDILITDFGFAKPIHYDCDGDAELSSTFCGSAAYAAPEILQGRPYDPRSHDMWSLGVILYIMACGHMPFDDSNVRKMLKVQLRNHIRFTSKLNAVLSHKLKSLIRRLIEADAGKRYTVEEALMHPFFEGYHGESRSRLIYRKLFDFFTGGRSHSHMTNYFDDEDGNFEACCSRGLRRRCKKHCPDFETASLQPCNEKRECSPLPRQKHARSFVLSRQFAIKKLRYKLKRRQSRRR